MGRTVAIHFAWTTYGSWLPGDPRGHWSPLFDFYGHLVALGHQLNLPDVMTVDVARSNLKEPACELTDADEATVARVIDEESSALDLVPYACAIEPTHVHLLIGATPIGVDRIAGRTKSRSSSAICQAHNDARSRTWTSGYWKVFIFNPDAIPVIQDYIEQHNERRGMHRVRFPWVRPYI